MGFMDSFYVQKFNHDDYGGSTICYGMMGPRDDKRANQFTADVIAYLTITGVKNIVAEEFKSNQTVPKNKDCLVKCFIWNGKKWK